MKLITRDTDYAARALFFIAKRNGRMVSVAELVKELKIPRPFLRKILQKLNKRRILVSARGQGGGFLLARAPKEIFLPDLIEVFQGPLKLNECIFKKRICPNKNTCALRQRISGIERYVFSKLNATSIASLMKKG
jgi:Rrf2 family cysteine metabolism transcriptional repressor